jgi:hypothetical protein
VLLQVDTSRVYQQQARYADAIDEADPANRAKAASAMMYLRVASTSTERPLSTHCRHSHSRSG